MARRMSPHFDHHHRELHRTRRRFSGGLAALFVLLAAVIGLHYNSEIHAATDCSIRTTASGRVFKGTAGFPGVKLQWKNTQTGATDYPITNANGLWIVPGICSQTLSSVSILSATPAGYSGPIAVSYLRFGMTDVPSYKTATSYPYQNSNFSCYHNTPANCPRSTSWLYDLASNNEQDFDFRYDALPTLPATATPAPNSKSAASPGSTPKPGGSTVGSTGASASADTTPPSTPANFEALVSNTNAVVSLSWTAGADSSAVKAYKIDRSLDQLTWAPLATGLTDQSYTDASAGFGVHYYYRLSAVDNAGNVSGYATADATTGAFSSTTDVGNAVSYASDDALAIALVEPATVNGDADCSIESMDMKLGRKSHPLVAGPYQLVCKNSSGDLITTYNKPISWTYNLKDKLKGYTSPKATQINDKGNQTTITNATFDKKALTLSFTTTSSDPTMILASVAFNLPINLITVVLLLMAMAAGAVTFLLRRRQKQNYNEYLRSKYYNF